ncbi:MAG: ABC transporter permease [Ardenticatenia bacterium]|nr:ABC transporter permease [Ardenticatenia bacterium]
MEQESRKLAGLSASAPGQRMVVQPGIRALDGLREVWAYRNLLWSLVMRDLKVRYKNSILGVGWSLLNPLLMMLVFTVVFTVFWPNNQVTNFPAFVLTGLLPWNLFQASVMGSAYSIVGNANLVKKVYFPREVLPMAVVLSNVVNFLLALLVLFPILWASGIPLTRHALWVPIILVIQVAFTVGLAFIFSTLNVFYRDTVMILDVGLLAWFFLTPIFYPMEFIPATKTLMGITLPVHRLVRWLNPMASIVDAYRIVLYGSVQGVFACSSSPRLHGAHGHHGTHRARGRLALLPPVQRAVWRGGVICALPGRRRNGGAAGFHRVTGLQ